MQKLERLLALLSKENSLEEGIRRDGSRLIGRDPELVGPAFWLHELYAPLSESEVSRLETKVLKRPIPKDYRSFLQVYNGVILFSGDLHLRGLSNPKTMLPFDIGQFNSDQLHLNPAGDRFFIGASCSPSGKSSSDPDPIFINSLHVGQCKANNPKEVRNWPNFWQMLLSETERLNRIYHREERSNKKAKSK